MKIGLSILHATLVYLRFVKNCLLDILISKLPDILSPDSARTTSFLYILSGPLHSSLDIYISFTLPSHGSNALRSTSILIIN
jgi:hypothetical protein